MAQPLLLAVVVALAALCQGALDAAAAVAIPNEVAAAPRDQQNRYLNQLAEQSLKEKLAAGVQRHQQRLRVRTNLIANMRANATLRRQAIQAQTHAAPPLPEPQADWPNRLAWLLGILVGLCGLLHFISRRASRLPSGQASLARARV